MNRRIFWIILIITFFLIFNERSEGAELNSEDVYYEKNGCIYLIGHPTEEERVEDLRLFNGRMAKRREINEREIKRNLYLRDLETQYKHELEIEKIRAKALENYLKATNSGDTINVRSIIHNRTILRNSSSQKNIQRNKSTMIQKINNRKFKKIKVKTLLPVIKEVKK